MAGVLQDGVANAGNVKGRLVLVAFRCAQRVRRWPKPLRLLGIPLLVLYRVAFEWVLGVELPWNLSLGAGARVFHGMGLVINDQAVIGHSVVLRHCTTIGVAGTFAFGVRAAPTIGDRVDVGSNVVILGPITIGDDVVIGAGSVVVKDVPAGAVVVGNPARILRINAPQASAASAMEAVQS